jgi:hypothetical protein
MTSKRYFYGTVIGLALLAGCATREEVGLNTGTMGYEPGSASDNSGTATETQKKARGSSSTGNIDGIGSGERSSVD